MSHDAELMEHARLCDDVLAPLGVRVSAWHEDRDADWDDLSDLDAETRETFAFSYGALCGYALANGWTLPEMVQALGLYP